MWRITIKEQNQFCRQALEPSKLRKWTAATLGFLLTTSIDLNFLGSPVVGFLSACSKCQPCLLSLSGVRTRTDLPQGLATIPCKQLAPVYIRHFDVSSWLSFCSLTLKYLIDEGIFTSEEGDIDNNKGFVCSVCTSFQFPTRLKVFQGHWKIKGDHKTLKHLKSKDWPFLWIGLSFWCSG